MSVTAPTGPGWSHEIKHDGYRLVARKADGRLRLWSRNMTDFTRHFTQVAEAVADLPADVMLDGEAVVFHADGHSNFAALKSRAGGAEAVLVAFDVLEIDGRDLRRERLDRRRALLAELLRPGFPGIMLSESIEGDGPTIFRQACALSCEGIISKRVASTYKSGRSGDWLKVKHAGFVRR